MILERRLAGGDLLVEGHLAEALRLTRTPLREAMVRLEGEGLLVKQRNHSFAVRQVSVSEYFQSLRVRQILESKAAVLAVTKVSEREIRTLRQRIRQLERATRRQAAHWSLDDDLHRLVASVGGNDVLAAMIQRLRMTTQLFEVGRPFERARADASEHLAILDALERRDAAAAEHAVLEHLRNIERDVLAIVSGG
jgi:DNA-binding GntR family transcriptional regulator